MKLLFSIFITLSILVQFVVISPKSASAISENVLIMQLQTGGAGTGTTAQEFILLYNNSDVEVNVTEWCLSYSSASNGSTFTKLACMVPPNATTELWVEADGYVSFATTEFITANPGFVPDFTFSSAVSIAGTGGHVRLVNETAVEVDRVGWGGAVAPEGLAVPAHASGQVLGRNSLEVNLDTDVNLVGFSSRAIQSSIVSGIYEKEIIIDSCPNIADTQIVLPVGYLKDESGDCFEDFCPNLDGLQTVAPVGFYKPSGEEDCIAVPLENSILFITELLPNAPSYDTGQEFIEIYNPNAVVINLTGYKLQLGPSFTTQFTFASGIIEPGQFLTFSDTFTGIVLPNTSATSVRLIAPAGNLASETGTYSDAGDDVSWALVEDVWIFTNQITPGAANKPYLVPVENEVLGVTTVYAPCPAGKYRNPETNRCKTSETAVSQLVPCSEDEYRNPDTNRCNKLSSATSSLVPCKEGQERNPDTNRCRNESVLGEISDLTKVTDIPVESTEGRVNWFIVSSAFLGAFGYMLYEWRFELRQKLLLARR